MKCLDLCEPLNVYFCVGEELLQCGKVILNGRGLDILVFPDGIQLALITGSLSFEDFQVAFQFGYCSGFLGIEF
jgi:hypothetical protein